MAYGAHASPVIPSEVRARALLLLRQRRRLRTDTRAVVPFGEWLRTHRPDHEWTARHFVTMQETLDRVTARDERRVYFSVPIRHGKTEHNTISYSAYCLQRDPRHRILVCSYNQRRAEKFSREIRRLTRAIGVSLSTERDAAGEWETHAGGGVQAVGAGAGVASVNADTIIVDDPLGSRDDAESQAKRDEIWDWFTNDILARCEPQTAVILTMSRWHQDDLAGRLLDQQRARWHVVDMPAEDTDGTPLWPELRGREWLEEKRIELGPYGFASLLMGRPTPRAGGMFKWADWQLLDTPPATGLVVRFWDTAGTEAHGKNDPDATAGAALVRLPDRRTVVLDVAHFRHEVSRRDAEIARVAQADAVQYRNRIRWRFEREAGVGGEARTAYLTRLAQSLGIPCDAIPATGKKTTRAEPLASAVGAGNVLLAPGAWRDALRTEAADFPNGRHDDLVDATAGAFNTLAEEAVATPFTFRV